MQLHKQPLNTGIPNKMFVEIKPVPKAEWKKKQIICYSFFSSQFGKILVASFPQGVCYVGYVFSQKCALEDLKNRFPCCILQHHKNQQHEHVKKLFAGKWEKKNRLLLYLKGTAFQLKVWEALLKIPAGSLSTYSKIAAATGAPNAQRATGTAIGKNPILYLIPCHRVIAQTGKMGGFYWGIAKKIELLNAENADYLHFTS